MKDRYEMDAGPNNLATPELALLVETVFQGIKNIRRLAENPSLDHSRSGEVLAEYEWVKRRSGDMYNSLYLACEQLAIDYGRLSGELSNVLDPLVASALSTPSLKNRH